MANEGVVIVGTGQAAFQLAGFLRAGDYGGRIRLIGDETHLPYQRPPLSKAYMSGECEAAGLTFQSHEYYVKQGIDLTLGCTVSRIDRARSYVETSVGERIPYASLVLATGARNRRLPIAAVGMPDVLDLRRLDDAATIRQKMARASEIVVVGAGFLGLEFAAVAAEKGITVTVVEASSWLMGRAVSASTGDCFRRHHESLGVRFLLGTTVSELTARSGGGCLVWTADGNFLDADLVVVSVGVQPNVELAEAAGLKTANGVVVDRFLQTEDAAISAIGDCAAFESRFAAGNCRIESVQNAVDQARCLARSLVGTRTAYDSVPWFWSDQGGRKLQIAGLSMGADRFVQRGDPEGHAFSVYCFRSDSLVGVESVDRPRDHMQARRLLQAAVTVKPDQVEDPLFDLKTLLPASC